MINTLKKLLEERKQLKGWKIIEKYEQNYQLFFVKQELDMNRCVETKEYEVTLYKLYEHSEETLQGEASCTILPTMKQDEIVALLDETELITSLCLNRQHELTPKQFEKPDTKEISFGGKSLKNAAFIIADNVFEADKFKSGYVNSLEIFVCFERNHFINSVGNEHTFSKSYAQIDVVVTWKASKESEEIELHRFFEFDSLKGDYVTNVVNDLLVEAKSRSEATTSILDDKKVKVVLKDENLKEFLSYFVLKTSVDNIYDKQSDAHVGYNFYNNTSTADKLTITLESNLPGSSKNESCDEDGVVLKSLRIVEQGKVNNLWGSNKKSQYLNFPVNGKYNNAIIDTGSAKLSDLQGTPYIEIVSLSDMNVDLLTGDFGSEIRFAYYYNKKGQKIAFTGGSIVGNVFDSINTLKLSNESVSLNNYKMPKFAILENVRIVKPVKDSDYRC